MICHKEEYNLDRTRIRKQRRNSFGKSHIFSLACVACAKQAYIASEKKGETRTIRA